MDLRKEMDVKENKTILKPNIIIVITTILIIAINTVFAFILGKGSIAYVIGNIYFPLLLVVGFFSIWTNYRNWKSRWNILFYVSLISILGNFSRLTQVIN
jgi:hypothetical protein